MQCPGGAPNGLKGRAMVTNPCRQPTKPRLLTKGHTNDIITASLTFDMTAVDAFLSPSYNDPSIELNKSVQCKNRESMNEIVYRIQKGMKQFGYKAKTVPIMHLREVQEAVGKLVRQGLVNERLHERWHFYLQNNESLPEAKTIVVVAMPQPITRLRFEWHGITYPADIPPDYFAKTVYESRAEVTLKDVLEPGGYRIARAHLALKTLAVRSGLARYGRNNITYIPGMGSLYSLVAFYTDFSSSEDDWQESKAMVDCDNCSLCRENCPTGSIPIDRFLIHAENCLGFLSENKPDFPYWVQLQPDWHNALIGCIRC
jgi:epoxyqueuosine reductase